ncbi:TRAP transporter small permease [Enterovibrio paralichthyis]|uniref:TRAP transporter small permease n=1 Tax=Enterovibrio paralichthyis TaxID=2853805 RepID=UPI001C464C3C|nr:TRAP transporter small permease [Enterovibrio paralichthyis]MBV7300587.1 TRAP transporter small permease [Enterovibrio paralichthyis]
MTALIRFSGLLLEGIIALALMLMMVATTVDVVGRYFFNAPLSGGVEIIELTLAVVVFGAYPLVTWRRAHICVDLLDDYVPDSWVRWREVVINLVSAAALGLVANKVWLLADRALGYGDETDVLAIPTAYLVYFISAMSWFSMLAALGLVVALVLRHPAVSPSPSEHN